MQTITTQNSKHPISCHMLWVSVMSVAVMLLVLTPIISLYYMGYISIEVAAGIFVLAVIYDSFLLFLIKRYNRDACHEDDPAPSSGDPTPGHF